MYTYRYLIINISYKLLNIFLSIKSYPNIFIQYFKKQLSKQVQLLIIDDTFPQSNPIGFRNTEFLYYLKEKQLTKLFLTKMKSPPDCLGKTSNEFKIDLKNFSKKYPNFKKYIELQNINFKYKSKLAYIVFESLTYYSLKFLEKNKIPFVFTLYPGGMFATNDPDSDFRKKEIFKSPMFKKVIVTQEYTKKYLLQKKLCSINKIKYIPLGFSQLQINKVQNKKYYNVDKNFFDICFVAFNYVENGYYKGYDILLDVARKVLLKHNNIRFHVVGNWNKQNETFYNGNNIIYYGVKDPDFFPNFYSNMDIFLSLSRTTKNGSFDGFPLGVDAGFCGVTLFASDELNQNVLFKDKIDIVLVKTQSDDIVNKIEYYYENVEKLYKIGENGKKILQKYVNTKYQCNSRINLFKKIIKEN